MPTDPRPCVDCGKPHENVGPFDNGKRLVDDWADPDDGHFYRPPSWEDFARSLLDRPGIDVERLAEAIFNATTGRGHAEHDSEECETCRWFRTLSNEAADDAAREYARLSGHPDTGDAPQS